MLLPCRLDWQEMLQNRAAERSRDGDQGAFLRDGTIGPALGAAAGISGGHEPGKAHGSNDSLDQCNSATRESYDLPMGC